jgi:hypothetical protein
MSILEECDMEKNCEAAEAVNTVCSFNKECHLIPCAASINCFHNGERNVLHNKHK